jgi:hypothetical protein
VLGVTQRDESKEGMHQCNRNTCGARCYIDRHAREAWTPLFNVLNQGDHEPGDYRIYKDFLLTCAAMSLKNPREVAVHLIEGMRQKRICLFYPKINLRGERVPFPPGIIELDGAQTKIARIVSEQVLNTEEDAIDKQARRVLPDMRRSGVASKDILKILNEKPVSSTRVCQTINKPAANSKNISKVLKKPSAKTCHTERFMIITHRESRQKMVMTLICKQGVAGHSLPPEGILETWKSISAKVSPGHIMSTDGSQAFRTVFRPLGIAHSSNAIHSQDIFTPLTSLPNSGLTSRRQKLFARWLPGRGQLPAKWLMNFELSVGIAKQSLLLLRSRTSCDEPVQDRENQIKNHIAQLSARSMYMRSLVCRIV